MRLLADPQIAIMAVDHRDRRMRVGSNYVEAARAARGRWLLIAETTEMTDDLVQDMIEVLTSFCARLYGRRSAQYRTPKALTAAAEGGVAS